MNGKMEKGGLLREDFKEVYRKIGVLGGKRQIFFCELDNNVDCLKMIENLVSFVREKIIGSNS